MNSFPWSYFRYCIFLFDRFLALFLNSIKALYASDLNFNNLNSRYLVAESRKKMIYLSPFIVGGDIGLYKLVTTFSRWIFGFGIISLLRWLVSLDSIQISHIFDGMSNCRPRVFYSEIGFI